MKKIIISALLILLCYQAATFADSGNVVIEAKKTGNKS